ncbi:MAG: YjjG family noncanonical pyrimidine nucleotidase [Bacteroidota bacterium]|nr:YjjG family noncanonical pyrimidine nucleotidase [Bacteroidota bacterium]MDX5429644.1 YjjG family noncanonical pyrimidine nucleotidase [Bacteroidota bacterium]MDX5468425.1 YjjG family noncanonical pyrimidine nucleotidase [Bacteroidota bacterium]
MKDGIKHLFFDLDHTLWDFEANSNETLSELFEEHRLDTFGLFDFQRFMEAYSKKNRQLWDQYNRAQISKEELRLRRFKETFEELGLEHRHHPLTFSDQYISRCTEKPGLFPHAHEVLGSLQEKYPMSIITNGFPESQHRKMKASNLHGYFHHLIISEEVGYAKPHEGIFFAALEKARVNKEEVVMIGDNAHADVEGAQKAGIKAIWFNPHGESRPDHVETEIRSLKELLSLF